MKISLFLAALFCIMFAEGIVAQKTNFSGKWVINKAKIDFGNTPEWTAPKEFRVEQNKKQMNVTRTIMTDQDNDHVYTESLADDGSPKTTATYDGMKRTSSFKWSADRKSFTISARSIRADGSISAQTTETWSLEDEGATLVIERHVEQTNGLTYDLKTYYEKQ